MICKFYLLLLFIVRCLFYQTWPTTLLVVSHDRAFLNNVVTDVVYLHTQQLDTYKGNYEVFNNTRTERLKSQQREYEAQKQYREHVQVSKLFLYNYD